LFASAIVSDAERISAHRNLPWGLIETVIYYAKQISLCICDFSSGKEVWRHHRLQPRGPDQLQPNRRLGKEVTDFGG
jgi:hypothetical protein